MYNNDVTIRKTSTSAPREIKASAVFTYIPRGITLDGSKLAVGELLLEGTCLVRDDITGKYEKYADGGITPAVIIGTTNATAADLAGINAGTSVKFTINGQDFVIDNTALAALTAVGGTAAIIAAVKAAVNLQGGILDDIASVVLSANKLRIATEDVGENQSMVFTGTYGVAGDKATVEGVLGIVSGASDKGTGGFPLGKSDPVILDESIKIPTNDAGANVDVTAGQVLVTGSVLTGMLIGVTAAFKAKLQGFIQFR